MTIRKARFAKGSFLFLFLLLIFVGCQSSSSSSGNYARINLGFEPHTLDPRKASETCSLSLMRMLFEGLTRIGPDDQPRLALAKEVAISEDLKTYTFTLRSSLWSNGDPLSASDFVYSWRKVLTPSFLSGGGEKFYVIKGAREIVEGILPLEKLGVRAEGDHTLIVELVSPTPYFLDLVSNPIFFPVNPEVEKGNAQWTEKIESYVCNGPFVPTKWRHHDIFTVEKNPTYWDEPHVALKGIEMVMVDSDTELKLFEKGKLHWAGSPLSTLSVDSLAYLKKNMPLKILPIAGSRYLRVNTAEGPLTSKKIRRALALAIDREGIVEHVTQGGQLAATGFVPPSFHLKESPYFESGNLEEAQALFQEGLDELGIEKISPLTLTYASAERTHLTAQVLQQEWNHAFGIQVKLQAVELKVYFDLVHREEYELALSSWFADYNDPIGFLEKFTYKGHSSNNTGWEDPHFADLIHASRQERDSKSRLKLLAESEEILIDAMPIIPLYHYTMLYLEDESLQGVFLSRLGTLDFKWATLDNAKQ
ncbi:MAG: Oligopeptide-binding protein OppA [Chlamydiae bacterium]|nr:Oligopeptide-binding protein OppA [Chlamydiota bacterium]